MPDPKRAETLLLVIPIDAWPRSQFRNRGMDGILAVCTHFALRMLSKGGSRVELSPPFGPRPPTSLSEVHGGDTETIFFET